MTGVPQLNDYGGIFNLVWQNNFEPKCLTYKLHVPVL